MIREAIGKLVEGANLTEPETLQVMEEIMTGQATPAQIGSFLTALRLKGETIDEITGCAQVMRQHATRIKTDAATVVDTCGTGGDRSHTFNISTISAFVVCGVGLVVAKHGNVSVSSKCGSADLLRALGVKIDLDPAKVEKCLSEIGIGFLFAPLLHGAMKYATPARKEIGIRTIFNILGPLTNPAGAGHQLLGVYDQALTEPLARVLGNLGSRHSLVVHGMDGLDEVSTTAETQVSELLKGEVKTYSIRPEDLGISRTKMDDLKGGDAETNAKIAMGILNGRPGPQGDIVCLNAGCAIYAGDKAKDISEGIELARKSLDSGKALEKLELLKEYTNR